MSITFRRLQVFVAAADDGNFRRTADRLGISQPAVSAQIRALEQHVGHALFQRRRGASSALSGEGREFLVRARELVEAQRGLADDRHAARRPQAAVLNVSVGPILLETRLKPMLSDFYESHPDIALEFVPFDPSGDGEQAIRSGAIDVSLYTGGPARSLPVKTEIISRVSASIYGSPELTQGVTGLAAELSAMPFVIPPEDYRITRWFAGQLASNGIRPRNIVARPPYMDVALQMVVAGKGLAVLFDEHAAEHAARGQVRAVGPRNLSAFRLMMMGKRALRTQVAPALEFLRKVAALRERSFQGSLTARHGVRTIHG